MHILSAEPEIMFNYVFPLSKSQKWQELYLKGINDLKLDLSQKESEILTWALGSSFKMRLVDMGTALIMKDSNLRKRFLLAVAISECDPIRFNDFYNHKQLQFTFLKLIIVGITSVFFMLIAYLVFTIRGWK